MDDFKLPSNSPNIHDLWPRVQARMISQRSDILSHLQALNLKFYKPGFKIKDNQKEWLGEEIHYMPVF